MSTTLAVLIVSALIFDFLNGFHDRCHIITEFVVKQT